MPQEDEGKKDIVFSLLRSFEEQKITGQIVIDIRNGKVMGGNHKVGF
jgi:hypothetical protein